MVKQTSKQIYKNGADGSAVEKYKLERASKVGRKIDLTGIKPEDAEYILVNNASLLSVYNLREGQKLYNALVRTLHGDDSSMTEEEKLKEAKLFKYAGEIFRYAYETAKVVGNKEHIEQLKALNAVMTECSCQKLGLGR